MKKIKKFVELVMGVFVLAIGIYMVLTYKCPTPPAMSGIAFIFIGFSMWFKNCLLLDRLCSKSCHKK